MSIRNFEEYGSTNPATLLITINKKPKPSSAQRGRINFQTSGQTAFRRWIFGGFAASMAGELNLLFDSVFPGFASLLLHCHTSGVAAFGRPRLVTAQVHTLYARGVSRPSPPDRSPTLGLLLGLLITLSAVVAYSAYITWQVTGLRKLQTELVDRNRKDSLQLLRIQNDLNLLAVAMRDMVSSDEPYPLTAWSAQFQRIRADLDDAMRLEAGFAAASRTPEQSTFLSGSFTQFWDAVDRIFALADAGKEKEAREQIQLSLQERQAALSTAVARLLVQNSENEEQAGQRIVQIYGRVQRQVYVFLAATLLAILLNGLSVIRWNRRLFARLAEVSERRSELAQKLIATQESTLRYISRELHDEFGQILTAVGSMLRRAGTHAPEGSSLRADLQEVLQTVQTTLESVRSLSQALHPVMLDEAGLESTMDWYIPTIERQTGIAISYEKQGAAFPVDGGAGVHIYRVLQEALNNVARHSGAKAGIGAVAFPVRQS